MESAVFVDERDTFGHAHGLQRDVALQRVEVGFLHTLGREPRDLRLQETTELQLLGETRVDHAQRRGEIGDARARVRTSESPFADPALDEARALQRRERLAHCGPADLETAGQLPLGRQAVARTERAPLHEIAQLTGDLLMGTGTRHRLDVHTGSIARLLLTA